ncbi:MAG: hypothetical protein RLZZ319_907 [Actinomycetota bacterium]
MGPIFLLGSPRSGTTLLRLLLSAHPDIVIAPESSFLTWFLPTYGDWTESDCESPRRDSVVADLMEARKFVTWGIDAADIAARIRETRPASYVDLVTIPYVLYCEKVGKPTARWGDKNNVHMDFVREIDALFPDCVFLHIVRDVRDCFTSGADIRKLDSDSPYKPQLAADATEFAAGWTAQNENTLDHLDRLPASRWASIRYEDLVRDARSTLAPVLDSWGLAWDDAMLAFHEENRAKQLEPVETSEWKTLVSEPITSSQIGRFRQSLTDVEIAALEAAGRETLERFHYLTPTEN